ncbi:MAG: oxidoreductase, partial [Gammaproteobacteria bacterium]|nr:oxidoreductase [Gammaproteobacteria bacterium]
MLSLFTNIPWAIVLILLPLAAGLACFLWPRIANMFGVAIVLVNALAVAGLGWQLAENGVYHHALGGWGAPLGIELFADGLSLLMLAATALVGCAVSVYATAYFENDQVVRFWPLWLLLVAALNALFLSADIFNLYVCLELTGLAAVSLTALAGSAGALSGAMRYLLATLLGSLFYLLGVALLYHEFGSVDIALLAERVNA